jgi:hypothetical protein
MSNNFELEADQLERAEDPHVPPEHDSDDDDYQFPRDDPQFELDDDLEPVPAGLKFNPRNKPDSDEENWGEKWYERVKEKYKAHPDDWSDSSDSTATEFDYSDEDNDYAEGDKWNTVRDRIAYYNAQDAEREREEEGGS